MDPGSRLPLLDLLVVGGLTIDRFADGSAAPGGSVVHIARAAAPRGLRLGIVTAAGPEPIAAAAVAELRGHAALVQSSASAATTVFRHGESRHGRRLWLEAAGGSVSPGPDVARRIHAAAVLFAPVAGEVPAELLETWDEDRGRGAILQGWLRGTVAGTEVRPLPLASIPGPVVARLAEFDLLVASREDLRADGPDPERQLAALRQRFGPRPALVVTDGATGLWLIPPSSGNGAAAPRHLPPPWRVRGAATVGAGDILAAFLLAGERLPRAELGRLVAKAEAAMRVVAAVLEERTGSHG